MRDQDYLKITQGYFKAPQGGQGHGAFGISYFFANEPTRYFRSLREIERARCAFIREAPQGFDAIRLARETKYYIHGINVPNRV
jgi:hypothetical protein